jgi:hypothetical protein
VTIAHALFLGCSTKTFSGILPGRRLPGFAARRRAQAGGRKGAGLALALGLGGAAGVCEPRYAPAHFG